MRHRHSRRDALKIFGAAAAVAVHPGQFARGASAERPPHRYFTLAEVKLGEGPFLDAQRRDADYLLKLEPDRLLANFRANAGLVPRAPVYGGWESVEPWIDIRCHGHTLGHYLGAAACMHQAGGDARFAARVDHIVAELAACQARTGGWLTAFPDGIAPLADSLAGRPFAGVPWYTTHKVLAGLRDAHVHRGSAQALEVLARFAGWIDTACKGVSETSMQQMLDREHGGMAEVLADTFELTGERRFLELAQRFVHRRVLEPLTRHEDRLDGLHANTQIPKIIGLQRIGQFAGPAEYGPAAEFFWETVVGQRSFATGGHGDNEHFFPVADFASHLGSAKTMETCCTHNMLRLTRALYARHGASHYFDHFERALFNGILASQDPDSGMMTYFQATRPGYVKLFHTPFDSFWCCTGSGMENHARYAESIYAHDGDTLFVNLYMASTLDWRERATRVVQATRFPDEDGTRISVHPGSARRFTLALRQPWWCPQMTVILNGRERKVARSPGGYFRITRRFRPGDVLDVRLPMSLRLEPLPHAPEYAAVMYGPIVLAGIVGKPVNPQAQIIVNERKSGEMLNETVQMPRWPRPLAELPAHFTRTDRERLTFIAAGFDGGPVQFIPWHRVAHERYNLYWRSASEVVSGRDCRHPGRPQPGAGAEPTIPA
ncbi:MAG TPA: beta-L-arabinofuranosidase domain-containing protein [Steroidobacteraceae bacterium]|nr:beta-L-arabinofuranosidase domain-containing protein [Steroidobacteraceae bacterium]